LDIKSVTDKRIVIVFLLLVSVAVAFFVFNNSGSDDYDEPVEELSFDTEVDSAGVEEYELYGQEIGKEDVQNAIDKLPDDKKTIVTEKEVAEALATERLLAKEAEEKKIVVAEDEVDEYINHSMAVYSMSREEYLAKLEEQGMTEEEHKEQLTEQMMIAKLINESINPKDYAVTDQEVDDFIEENKADYELLFEENPELEDVLRLRIRKQMEFAKKQELVMEYIEEIRGQ